MKRIKKILASLMVAVMVLTAAPLSGFVGMELNLDWLSFDWLDFTPKASAATYSGKCGANLAWSLDTETGELIISGEGEMPGYSTKYSNGSYITDAPWGSYVSSIRSVTIQKGVTSIGYYAFYGCTSLTSVTIPDSATSIGDYVFRECTSLTSIAIPDSVTSIGDSAFSGCTSLTSITIPDSVISIDYYAFNGCTSLTSITVVDDNTAYSSDEYGVLFNKDKTSLVQYPSGNKRTSYTIPDSVTSIGYYAFYDCTSLTSITIPDSVTSIGSSAFRGCKGLTSITIPDSVTSIGDYAFYNCNGLTSVTIGNSVTSIGPYAFSYCKSLTSITVPDSVTSIGSSVFYNCTSLTSITIPDSVTSIGHYAFDGCRNLTSITIPDSVTSIGSSAFSGCTSLTSITIPDSVASIGDWAFDSCPKLVLSLEKDSYAETYANNNDIPYYYIYNELDEKMISVVVTSKLRFEINKETYTMTINCSGNMMSFASDDTPWSEYKPYIKHIIIAEGCEGISASAFKNFKGLKSIEISDSVTSIGSSAFSYCTSLTSITIPDSVTSIGSSAFSYCTSLTSITIGNGVISIGYSAFSGCTSLTSITIGNGVISIGADAFYNCTSLASITIPDSVTSIGSDAFYNCTSLTSITIGNGVTSIGSYAFSGCTNLGSITLPYSVSSINNSAFAGCQSLEKLKVYNKNCTFGSEIIGYYTTICGYAGSTAEAYADEMGYDFELIFDGDHEHIYSNNCDAECNVCGYVNPDAGHTYDNDCDAVCNYCDFVRTPNHTDDNNDGLCDACEKALSDILVGVTQNFKVKAGETVYIKFVPANSGVYTFYSSSSTDTYGYVYDANKNQLDSDDDDGDGNNFSITYTFKSGTVYYLGVRYYSPSSSGEIPVTIRLDQLICDHNNTHEEHQDSTCTENGYDKVICDDCGEIVSTTSLPLLDHDYKKITAPPTCVDEGTVVCLCRVCRDAYISEILDPLGHSELVWVTVKVPSIRNEGIMNQVCPACGEVFDTKTVPAISLSADSTANIDFETNTISGFVSGSSSIGDYLSATNNGYTFTCESEKIATGTVITLTAGEDTINEFEAVIFGDTNGDSWYDGQDAIIVDCLANGMLTKDDVSEAVYMAADCNHDGVIDQLDVDLLNQAGALLSNVDQSKPTEVLLETSSAYVEYLDLIDQSPEIEDETDTPEADAETEDTTPEQDANKETNFFEMILNFIRAIIEMILSRIPVPYK